MSKTFSALASLTIGLALTVNSSTSLAADESSAEEEASRRYTTREERRDEGNKYPVTEWLSVSGLVEFEFSEEKLKPIEDEPTSKLKNSETSAEAVFEFTPLEWAKAEIVYEYDGELHKILLDEAVLSLEYEDFEFEMGKLYVPFGEYFSHFVSGPILEFGETRGRSAVLSYSSGDLFDVSLFAYEGNARKLGSGDSEIDWGFSLELSPIEVATFAVSYISDLADSDEDFLEDFDRQYEKAVPAISGYALLGFEQAEITAEYVYATRRFRELDAEYKKPFAWNTEIQFYPLDDLAIALRFEGSRQLEDAPEKQSGIAFIIQVFDQTYLAIEFLRGAYEAGFAEDADENELRSVNTISAQLSIGI